MTPDQLEQAACKGKPVDLFYQAAINMSRDVGRPGKQRVEQWRADNAAALAICARCPDDIRQACLDEAVQTRDWHGVRGGMTPPEIRALRNKLTSRHGTRNRYRSGCHCGPCTAANQRYYQLKRERDETTKAQVTGNGAGMQADNVTPLRMIGG